MLSELFIAVAIGVVFLTYANGANDNFKGVATLYGSGVLSYRTALIGATAATWLGSIAAIFVADQLVRAFSGKGLVDPAVLSMGTFPVAVAGGAALTVLLATRLGLPISTTHALIGALVGGGLSAGSIDAARLGTAFALPLVVSPLLATSLAAALYTIGRFLWRHWQLEADDCLCIEPNPEVAAELALQPGRGSAGAARVATITEQNTSQRGFRAPVAGLRVGSE